MRTRYRIEVGLSLVSLALFVLTLITREWIEAFGFDPDHGSGALEWAIVGVLLASTIVFGLLARTTRRRMAAGPRPSES